MQEIDELSIHRALLFPCRIQKHLGFGGEPGDGRKPQWLGHTPDEADGSVEPMTDLMVGSDRL